MRGKQKMPRGVKLRGFLNLPTWAVFIVNFQFSLHNYPGNLTLNPFTNAKRITHALYQNMGDEVVDPRGVDSRLRAWSGSAPRAS